jgi:hypothetical protein
LIKVLLLVRLSDGGCSGGGDSGGCRRIMCGVKNASLNGDNPIFSLSNNNTNIANTIRSRSSFSQFEDFTKEKRQLMRLDHFHDRSGVPDRLNFDVA